MNNREALEHASRASEWNFDVSTVWDIEQMPGFYMQMLNCFYMIKGMKSAGNAFLH